MQYLYQMKGHCRNCKVNHRLNELSFYIALLRDRNIIEYEYSQNLKVKIVIYAPSAALLAPDITLSGCHWLYKQKAPPPN